MKESTKRELRTAIRCMAPGMILALIITLAFALAYELRFDVEVTYGQAQAEAAPQVQTYSFDDEVISVSLTDLAIENEFPGATISELSFDEGDEIVVNNIVEDFDPRLEPCR